MSEIYLLKAIRSIQKFMYYVHAKNNRKNQKNLYRISVSKGCTLFPYILCLSHEDRYEEFKMIYSLSHHEYFIELWLHPETEFIIKFKESILLHPQYPTKLNTSKELVNFIESPILKNFDMICTIITPLHHPKFNLEFTSNCKTLPKIPEQNEDAYFLTSKTLGIADGVGGIFYDFGISSKDFSHELMQKCKSIVSEEKNNISCKEVVKKAYNSVLNGGSSTYLLASLKKNRLYVSNLGDCGLLLFRYSDGSRKLVFQTSAKQYGFNTPFQISKEFNKNQLCKRSVAYSRSGNLRNSKDIDSDEYCITVYPGDILVVGSDGLLDNVYTEEIQKIVKLFPKASIEDLSNQILFLAKKRSQGKENTPFQDRMKEVYEPWVGGKPDDITVIVSVVR
ncbi:hypothetical protein SteCoe_4630 [Stentor coeruleus]|uniref:Protein phosphatase n=1 Tax=Stentor coeruleus TaxID=5963 RepID=A0A1R2CUH7_9CILI|nr:hypothetical protein SteCoe_4630 [Stentor coeruleus]